MTTMQISVDVIQNSPRRSATVRITRTGIERLPIMTMQLRRWAIRELARDMGEEVKWEELQQYYPRFDGDVETTQEESASVSIVKLKWKKPAVAFRSNPDGSIDGFL
ncbi:hypothetical protein ACMX2H_18285 [Arthrobacter sulfonylureivorans]|uniref:hypothetical protein n=1 Tax=Arthrobacter sulfonylureivorans TaxID=2486855 RepID=UPI0039E382FA